MFSQLRRDAGEWCRGRNWVARVPLLAFFAYILLRHLFDPAYSSIIDPLNLGIHELGHIVFSVFGQFIGVAGGTFLQLAVPILGFFNFYRQRDFFAISLTFGWLAVNVFEVARYAGDARSLNLPLVSIGGGDVYHDWEFMLDKLNLLQFDFAIAAGLRVAGAVLVFACLASGSWLLLKMAEKPTR